MKISCLIPLMLLFLPAVAQKNIEDTLGITKASQEREVIDPAIFKKLEKFNTPNESIVYIFRLSSYVGAAFSWKIKVNFHHIANLNQLEFIPVHLDSETRCHHFQMADMGVYYSGFKPNKYYYIMLRGSDIQTGYLNAEALSRLKTCKHAPPLPRK